MAESDSLDVQLIKAAIDLFGQRGFDSASTRAIADAAGAQMSAITYHFGGKDGLYLACARYIAQQMGERLGPALQAADTLSGEGGDAGSARRAILSILGGVVTVMMRDDVASMARFVVREQMNPTPAFAALYDGAISGLLGRLSSLIRRLARDPLSEEQARLRSIALMGQVFVFRFARAVLMTSTGWQQVGDRETDIVRAIVLDHGNAVLNMLERGGEI